MHSCINKGHMAEKHDECVPTVDSQPEEQLGHHSYNLANIAIRLQGKNKMQPPTTWLE